MTQTWTESTKTFRRHDNTNTVVPLFALTLTSELKDGARPVGAYAEAFTMPGSGEHFAEFGATRNGLRYYSGTSHHNYCRKIGRPFTSLEEAKTWALAGAQKYLATQARKAANDAARAAL